MNLKKDKILITGSTRGIGLALLRKFHSEGFTVYGTGTNRTSIESAQKVIPNVRYFVYDSKETSLESLAKEIEINEINVLINNSGIQYNDSFEEEGDLSDRMRKELEINFLFPALLIHRILPVFLKKENSKILNLTSALSFVSRKNVLMYSSSKAALSRFTRSLALQLKEYKNIQVVEVIPPLVATDMTKGRVLKGTMSAEKFASEFYRSYQKGKKEFYIGKTGLLHLISKFSGKLAERIVR
ncbi:SDR family NAD(P)-dependent oxidoreductase [Leptospira idonii]|uniref:SDR family NAD(P)-dependent oxidoreductase n=1 Tax=Leptospira idonii TaxID=1193500 RepID=A0A4R9M291_9LEPT|nr:SDR family NAD(P)-dependent oxidoreductase [Leptospira idonii]TGN20081.1 SDR family NAD(P)-dependent oxidoreductase [Leptospira idonii]